MTQHIDTLRLYFQLLSSLELVALRHDAVQLNDVPTKELIDEEIKRRDLVGRIRGVEKRKD